MLGIKYCNKYYFDISLAFCSNLSYALFNKFRLFLLQLVRKKSMNQSIIHSLSYFLFAEKPGDFSCKHTLHIFRLIYAQLGVSIAKEKTVESKTRLTFLGIELDIVQIRLLQDILGSMY